MKDLFDIVDEFVSMQTDRSIQRIADEMKMTIEDLRRKIESRSLDSNELLDFVRCSRSMELLDGVLDRLRPQPTAGKPRNNETAGSPGGSRDMKRLLN